VVVVGDNVALGVELSDVDLGGSVVLNSDETASGRALARGKKLDVHTLIVLHICV